MRCFSIIYKLEIPISQMFPRHEVQRDYPEGEMGILCGNNVEIPLVLKSLKMKHFFLYNTRQKITRKRTNKQTNKPEITLLWISITVMKTDQSQCRHSYQNHTLNNSYVIGTDNYYWDHKTVIVCR